ncbi:MAG: type II toxin-antitoxin system prevent-host-death family antitoxin [Acidobacteriota bacterium]
MKTVGARQLKNLLGAYLKQVKEGTAIIVTERGRPIAELRPLEPAATDEESRLLELAALGLVTPRSSTMATDRPEPISIPGKPLSQTVIEDREDRI